MNTAAPSIQRSAVREYHPPFLLDAGLVLTVLCLVGFSLVMVYSTTGIVAQEKYGDALYFLKRQVAAVGMGLFLMFAASRVRVEHLRRVSPYFFFICAALLLITLLPGVGHRAGGAQRWINLGIIRFQPGELVKVLFIIFIAGFWARHETRLGEF